MKKLAITLCLLFIVSTVINCAPASINAKKATELSSPFLQNILKAIKTENYNMFIKDMDNQMKAAMPKEKFIANTKSLKETFGDFVSSKYFKHQLTQKDKHNYLVVDYLGHYTKLDKVNIRIVLEKTGSRYYVAGLWFKNPKIDQTYTSKKATEITSPLLQNMLNAIRTENYSLFIKDMNNQMKAAIPEEKFKSINKYIKETFGDYVSSKYSKHQTIKKLGRDYLSVDYLARYKKFDKVIIKVVVEKVDNRYLIAGFWLKDPEKEVTPYTDKNYDAKKIAEISYPILQNLIKAMNTDNYDMFIKDMNNQMKTAMPKNTFNTVNKNITDKIGTYVSSSFSSFELVRQKDSIYIVVNYKATYSKTKNKVGIKIILEKKDKVHLLTGLWFDAPELKEK